MTYALRVQQGSCQDSPPGAGPSPFVLVGSVRRVAPCRLMPPDPKASEHTRNTQGTHPQPAKDHPEQHS